MKKSIPIAFLCISALLITSAVYLNNDKIFALPVIEQPAEDITELAETVREADTKVKSNAPRTVLSLDSTAERKNTAQTEASETVPETPLEIRERRITEELCKMTSREKLGQMIIADYTSWEAGVPMYDYSFGSYILFARDFADETPETISAKLAQLQKESKYGAFISVDEEGGTVVRVSKYPQFRELPFKSPRTVYAYGGLDGIKADNTEKALLLSSLGINMNIAPVADISLNEYDFMYWRSVGLDEAGTSDFVKAVITTSRENGILSVAKHFPGYGSAVDTHTGMAHDTRPLEELSARDLVPFKAAIEENVSAILVSHIITDSIDPDRPASVSPKVVSLLRNDMGYGGIIMTDDLAMSGITDYCTTGNAALEAIFAGCDLLCCTNWTAQYPALAAALDNGTLTPSRLDESVTRILRLKYDFGMWE